MSIRSHILRAVRLAFLMAIPVVIIYVGTVIYVVSQEQGSPAAVPADCGIVFGTAVWPVYDREGTIIRSVAGPGMTRRISTAADLYRKGSLHRLFVTGGVGDPKLTSEAQVMKNLASSLGVPAERITVEDRARSTWENLLYTHPLTSDCTSVVAISDAYHLARIAFIARMQGWNLPTYPADQRPPLLFFVQSLLREAAGIDLLVLVELLT